MASKREILERTVGIEDSTRVYTQKLEQDIKDLDIKRMNISICEKDRREIKQMMGTDNFSEAIRRMKKEAADRRGL